MLRIVPVALALLISSVAGAQSDPGASQHLFDAGETARRAGDAMAALGYYTRYVQTAPNGPHAAEANRRIEDLRGGRVETDERRPAAASGAREEAEAAGRGLRIGGIVFGVIGVAAIGLGVAGAVSDASRSSGSFHVANTGAVEAGFIVGGVVFAGIGTAMYFVGRNQRDEALRKGGFSSRVVPAVAPGYIGAAFLHDF